MYPLVVRVFCTRGGRTKWNPKNTGTPEYYVSRFSYRHCCARGHLPVLLQFVSQEAQARTDELRRDKSILRYGGTSGISLSPTLGAQL